MWFIISIIVAIICIIPMGIHKVSEGYVGVYWRGGALLPQVSEPGFHLKMPLMTFMEEIQVTVQTDAVTGIPCGTSGGVLIHFDKVEVVNRLEKDLVYDTIRNYTIDYDKTWIFDKIHHEINQFCSSHTLQEVYIDLFETLDESLANAIQSACDVWAPGIEIIAVRVTKPRIPNQIRANYEAMEAEKTKLMIAVESQKVVAKQAETERKRATIEAQMVADVSAIKMNKEIAVNKAQQEIQQIMDQVHINRERARSDAHYYSAMKEAEANSKLLTDNYLEYIRIQSLANNTKIYFGDSIPEMYVNRPDASVTPQVQG
jgi:regulator of protease activity HflC (stomatin/prohibitin superfamily)